MLRCKSEYKFTPNLYIINVYNQIIIHDSRNQLYILHEYTCLQQYKHYIQLQYDQQESLTDGEF